jgi:heme oxygenase-like protein
VPDHTDADPSPPPASRGPLSAWTIARVWQPIGEAEDPPAVTADADGFGDDLQLALYLAYEGHFRRLGAVDEWDPVLIAFRRRLEDAFLAELQRRVGRDVRRTIRERTDLRRAIPALIEADTGPSLSRYMEVHGTLQQMRDFALHRSAYQLKEGDAHTLGISRLGGRAKQILAAIQAGEYGADEPDRVMHSELFAQTMRGLGLDDRPNASLDRLPASALMVSNLISMFGLNRRWRGALVGHLAVFEMTSVVPMGRYGRALERLGADEATRRFYDVHVMADAEHELMALDMACALAEDEPALVGDIVFGAYAVLAVEREFAGTLLRSWGALALAA